MERAPLQYFWFRLRGTWHLVETGRIRQSHKHSDLAGRRWPLVEATGTLVRADASGLRRLVAPAVKLHLLTVAPCAAFQSTLPRH